jgi:phosphohistidine phosphatase
MNLWLMRHCAPEPGLPMDGSRPLTDNGVKQAEDMAAFLVADIGRVDYVVTSPFMRTAQTAQVMGKALGAPVIAASTALQPDGNPADAWKEIMRLAVDSKDVLVVSHHELLGPLMFWLLGLTGTDKQIRMEWGAIAHLKGAAQSMCLHWMVSPKLVLREEEAEVIEAARELVESLPDVPMGEEALVRIRPISDLEDGGQLWQVTAA